MRHPVVAASPLLARVVAIMDLCRDDRGLRLMPFPSRVIREGEIHELIATDEAAGDDATRVDAVGYLAFVEFTRGGVVLTGASVQWRETPFGVLRGFDDTHMPNHMNIVIQVERRTAGLASGWCLGDVVTFNPPAEDVVLPGRQQHVSSPELESKQPLAFGSGSSRK